MTRGYHHRLVVEVYRPCWWILGGRHAHRIYCASAASAMFVARFQQSRGREVRIVLA